MNAESTLLLSELPYYAMVTGAPHFNDPHHTVIAEAARYRLRRGTRIPERYDLPMESAYLC